MLLAAGDDVKDATRQASQTESPTMARLIPVQLPITGNVDVNVKRMIDQVLSSSANQANGRPTLILEFRSGSESSGNTSEFERSLAIARFLASDRLNGVRTVAFLPKSVHGHAVLPVLACEQIVMARDAELGQASISDDFVDESMRASYREIAERRRTIPPAIALGMLDRDLEVSRVQTLDGMSYMLADELKTLQDRGEVTSVEAIAAAGDLVNLTGNELRLEYGFASHLAQNRNQLLAALELPSRALEEDPSLGGEWHAIRVDVSGMITAQNVNWVLKTTRDQLEDESSDINFVCVAIDSPGGSLIDSLRLAGYLAGLDATKVRTVAYVNSEARGDAALIAWACDQLVIQEDAVLGGPGADNLRDRELPELKKAVQALATESNRDWSLPVALVDTTLELHEYTNQSDETRFFSDVEHKSQPDPTRWTRGELLDLTSGMLGSEANRIGIAKHLADDLVSLRQIYQIEDELERVEPNWAHVVIDQLSSPQIAGTLLFIAWFALIVEVSQPGIGVGGFISALCFVLFFWSNVLNGTAAWLEALLFVAGVISLVIEIFVLPGFGIFGFGGACLVVASLILASQTFVVPRNPYQYQQFANSLMMVAAGLVGAFASLLMVRKYLPDAPVFRRLMLAKPDAEELEEREALTDFRHLLGKRGKTITQLTPSGKARFGDEDVDVISDGDLVSRGSEVFVAEVRGNRVLVQQVDEGGRA